MVQMMEVSKNNTTVRTGDDGYTVVNLHGTEVIRWNDKEIILNSGGWQTATTKSRMNQASNQFNLGLYVQQKKGKWTAKYRDKVLDFVDGMIIKRWR